MSSCISSIATPRPSNRRSSVLWDGDGAWAQGGGSGSRSTKDGTRARTKTSSGMSFRQRERRAVPAAVPSKNEHGAGRHMVRMIDRNDCAQAWQMLSLKQLGKTSLSKHAYDEEPHWSLDLLEMPVCLAGIGVSWGFHILCTQNVRSSW